jgi:hypothetical protein
MSIPRFMLVGGGSGPTVTRRPAGFGWRLVGGNNHELGRSVAPTATVEDCRAGVLRLKDDVQALTGRVRRAAAEPAWVWVVELDGVPAAVSGRAYQRQRECRYALNHFLAAIPLAGITRDWSMPVAGPALGPAATPHVPGPGAGPASGPAAGPGPGPEPAGPTTPTAPALAVGTA